MERWKKTVETIGNRWFDWFEKTPWKMAWFFFHVFTVPSKPHVSLSVYRKSTQLIISFSIPAVPTIRTSTEFHSKQVSWESPSTMSFSISMASLPCCELYIMRWRRSGDSQSLKKHRDWSRQSIATSAEVTPKCSFLEGKWDPLFQGNLGWWNIIQFHLARCYVHGIFEHIHA